MGPVSKKEGVKEPAMDVRGREGDEGGGWRIYVRCHRVRGGGGSLFASGVLKLFRVAGTEESPGHATAFAAAPEGFKEWKSSRTHVHVHTPYAAAHRHPSRVSECDDELRRTERGYSRVNKNNVALYLRETGGK